MRGTPDGLRRLACTVRLEADRARLMALRVRASGEVRWRSPAAELYRQRVTARARRLEAAAGRAHDLACEAERLADAVEREASP
jgi:hypothetical protein